MCGPLGNTVVGSRLLDPLQLWKKNPQVVDPLDLTGSVADKREKEDAAKAAARAEQLRRSTSAYNAQRSSMLNQQSQFGQQGSNILGGK